MRSYSATCGDDRLLVFRTAYNRRQYGEKDADDAIVLTDRAVYRPGQAVCFKAILFHREAGGERTLLCGRRTVMRFRDVNRRLIAEQTLTSGDFGGVDGCFTVPEGLLNGFMTVECDGLASVGVRVEEYKRPAFEVLFDPVEGNVAPNGKARVTAQARTL